MNDLINTSIKYYSLSAFTLFVGVTFPFFGDLLGFFGGFGFAPTSYFVSLSLFSLLSYKSIISKKLIISSMINVTAS